MIIDSHTHLGKTEEFWFYDVSLKRILREMERLDIRYAVNAHSDSLIQKRYEKGCRESIDAYERSGGRILSYHIFDPGAADECLGLMDKAQGSGAFRGIKIHPSLHGVYADDPAYDSVWQYADDKGLPIMSHTWAISSYNPSQRFSTPERFIPYIERYPNVTLICGHAGGREPGISEAIRLAAKYPNVYLDIAGDVYNDGLIDRLTAACSARKVLFASDMLWINPATQLGMVLASHCTEDELDRILWKNAAEIFGIDVQGGQA